MPGRQDDILLDSALAEGAMEALARGDAATHDSLIVASAKTLAHCDVIMLGQFTMARAREKFFQDLADGIEKVGLVLAAAAGAWTLVKVLEIAIPAAVAIYLATRRK